MVAVAKSVIDFMPWQKRFFADEARVMVGCVHRQGGKDFTSAAIAVDDALVNHSKWFIVSITQRQADATFEKCAAVAKIFKSILKKQGEITVGEEQFDSYAKEIDHMFRCTARTLYLPGGGSVTALPGRDPDTLAGLTGNVIFTEFGLFPNGGYAHWRVVFPLSTRGFRVIVISTPRGRNTKYYELVSNPETYSVHLQTIEKSVAEGFVLRDNNGNPTTVEEFKKLYGDESGWQREYMCEFTGDLAALISWAKLMSAANADCRCDVLEITNDSGWKDNFFDGLAAEPGRIEWGWDVARTGDVSALLGNVKLPDGKRELRKVVTMQNTSFATQRAIVRMAMKSRPDNVGCGDSTGLGMDSNETLAQEFGANWKPVAFTSQSKREMASAMRTAFDDGSQIIPPLDGKTKFIATDIYAMQVDETGGNLKLVAGTNELLPASHCDVCTAAMLTQLARSLQGASPSISTWSY